MIYEVHARLFFAEIDEARDFYADCEKAMDKSVVVNPQTPNIEIGTIHLIENHHDEDPNASCTLLLSEKTKP